METGGVVLLGNTYGEDFPGGKRYTRLPLEPEAQNTHTTGQIGLRP